MEQNLQNLQLPVSIWKIVPTCCHRNKGEVEYISSLNFTPRCSQNLEFSATKYTCWTYCYLAKKLDHNTPQMMPDRLFTNSIKTSIINISYLLILKWFLPCLAFWHVISNYIQSSNPSLHLFDTRIQIDSNEGMELCIFTFTFNHQRYAITWDVYHFVRMGKYVNN